MQDDTLLKSGFLLYVEKTLPDFTFRDINRKIYVKTCTADERRWNMDSYEKRKFV